jgi:hypothetical protein
MDDAASKLVLDMAEAFLGIAERAEPRWEEAYYRLYREPLASGANASCVGGGEVRFIPPLQHRDAFSDLHRLGTELLDVVHLDSGALLLTIDERGGYGLEFECSDLDRQRLTTLDGSTGRTPGDR